MSRSRKTLRTIVTGDFMGSLSYVSSRAAARLWVWRKPADTGPPLNDSSGSQTWEPRKITSCATQRLSKNISNLIDQFLIFKIAGFYLRQLLKQLPLLARQTRRRNDGNRNEEIALATPSKDRHALTTHAKDCPRLRAGGNLQRFVAIECRHFYISSQRSLGKRDWNGGIQIISLAFELFVLGHVNHDVKISGRTTKSSRFAFSLQAQS